HAETDAARDGECAPTIVRAEVAEKLALGVRDFVYLADVVAGSVRVAVVSEDRAQHVTLEGFAIEPKSGANRGARERSDSVRVLSELAVLPARKVQSRWLLVHDEDRHQFHTDELPKSGFELEAEAPFDEPCEWIDADRDVRHLETLVGFLRRWR